MWKGSGNINTLLFSLKGLEILHQERRGQVNKSGPANKQHTYQSITFNKCSVNF
jgi:hypothetical protein